MGLIQKTPLKKPGRKLQQVTAAEFNRVLDRSTATKEPYAQRSIYPSGLCEITVAEFVMNYFEPLGRIEPWKMKMYVSHGKAAERVIQEGLFRSGCLQCPHIDFQETTVYCPKTWISGRADGIIEIDKLKNLGSTKILDPFEGESETAILEIKETSDYGYSLIKTPEDIPDKFKWAQCAYQHILGIPKTCFLYINRDSMNLKTMFYVSTDKLWQTMLDKVNEIQYHVKAETVPTDDGDVSVWDIMNGNIEYEREVRS